MVVVDGLIEILVVEHAAPRLLLVEQLFGELVIFLLCETNFSQKHKAEHG